MFQAANLGGKQGRQMATLAENAAVKRVTQLMGLFHRTKRQHRRSTAPVFVVIDTNSLDKRVLRAWARGHANSQYQQHVSAGQVPLVNGVIPMAVLREVDFYNKQGVRKVGSLQGILEAQFRHFNEDRPCFLHPQGIEQVYEPQSSVRTLSTAAVAPQRRLCFSIFLAWLSATLL